MTTTAAQEAFLKAFHAEYPAVTAEALGSARAADGRSSYEILCDRVDGSRRVLDLGCGDGLLLEVLARTDGRRLAGVDLSPEALALARRRPALSGAVLVEGRAQELPFADGGFDACVSHMALMLMGDIERVVAEVARVLSPGGRLACVLGGGAVGGEAFELFLSLLRSATRDVPLTQRVPALGDPRSRSREGLVEVLGPAGLTVEDWETVPLDLGGSPGDVWTAVSGIYDLGPLDRSTVVSLRESFLTEAGALAGADGRVRCGFAVHVATAQVR